VTRELGKDIGRAMSGWATMSDRALNTRQCAWVLTATVFVIGASIGGVFGEPILGAGIACTLLAAVSYGIRIIGL
jgi:hypothetical protein